MAASTGHIRLPILRPLATNNRCGDKALADAVLVGRGTLETDRMAIDLPDQQVRQRRIEEGKSEYPLRVILSGSGNIPTACRSFKRETLRY